MQIVLKCLFKYLSISRFDLFTKISRMDAISLFDNATIAYRCRVGVFCVYYFFVNRLFFFCIILGVVYHSFDGRER